MVASLKRIAVVVLAGAALLGTGPAARAQFNFRRVGFVPPNAPINPHYYLNPYMTLNQYAFNTATLGQAYASVPPYLYGYNPYPSPIFSGGPVIAGGGPSLTTGFPGGAALTTGGFPGYGAALSTGGGYGGGGYGGGGYGGGGYGGYPYSYDLNGYTGYLRGAADVTIANAQYQKIIQEARLARERATQESLVTRRKIREEAEYERKKWLEEYDPEVVRQRDRDWWLNRARHDSPVMEVLSGQALNTLLAHLINEQGKGEKGPNVPLSPDLLKSINVVGPDTRGNVGLLKNDGKLDWPLPLQGSEFADGRERLNKLIADAVQQARFNQAVDPGKLRDMDAELARMEDALDKSIRDNDMLPQQYVEARRYLNMVGDAVKALKDPNISRYLTGKWPPAGTKNVAELVKFMADNGLRFAPAVTGDGDAYQALYHALVGFDAGMTQMAARGSR
jgi:hypothetical protein